MYNQHKILRVFQLINLLKASPAKSINHLAKVLEMDSRSIYRYLDLLRVLGFSLEKNSFNRFYIVSEDNNPDFSLSPEESVWLKGLILTAGKESIFCDSVLKKLSIYSETSSNGDQLYKAHLSKLVSDITEAINNKQQIILKKYFSVNSQSIEDRMVEPIHFTDDYGHLVAFEVSTKSIKHFHIERISAIELSGNAMQHTNEHKKTVQDVFGFAKNGENTYRIDLYLSLRAYVLLKEEYPNTIPYLKFDRKKDQYRFVAPVNNLAPVARFIKGLGDEIVVNSLG